MIKTALVTGAAAGIGRACSLRLAREGHTVGLLDINLADCRKVVEEIEAEAVGPSHFMQVLRNVGK